MAEISKKQKMKLLRKLFREACLKRDNYQCVMCGYTPEKDKIEEELSVHHITDRKILPNDGYTPFNGISLCCKCHEKAEVFHESEGMNFVEGFKIEDLYLKIGSSLKQAVEESGKL